MSTEEEFPGKAQTLLVLHNPYLPEPGEVLGTQYLDHVQGTGVLPLYAAWTARQERAAYG